VIICGGEYLFLGVNNRSYLTVLVEPVIESLFGDDQSYILLPYLNLSNQSCCKFTISRYFLIIHDVHKTSFSSKGTICFISFGSR
jgi:hypothetical protein